MVAAVGAAPAQDAIVVEENGASDVLVETQADGPCFPDPEGFDRYHRLINCGNGTVHDTVSGLLWLANPSCLGTTSVDSRSWYLAQDFAAQLAPPQCGLSDHSQPGDWRLPTLDEWLTFLEPSCANPPRIAGNSSGCHSSFVWDGEVPLVGFWALTTYPLITSSAYAAGMLFGTEFLDQKTDRRFVWPVRGSSTPTITHPSLVASDPRNPVWVDDAPVEVFSDPPCIPAAGDPDADDRFIDCDNGTVHDTVTGLLWLEDANCLGTKFAFGCGGKIGGAVGWFTANAVAAMTGDGDCGLSDGSRPGDWRLPTTAELEEVLAPACADEPKLAGRSGGCYDQAANGWACDLETRYWTPQTFEGGPFFAMAGDLASGQLIGGGKFGSAFHLWLVRRKR